jgi:hypothetical protein
MHSLTSPNRQHDGRLWATAFALSLVINGVILLGLGFTVLKSEVWQKKQPQVPPPPAETTVTIFPDMVERLQAARPAPSVSPATDKPRFARTSEDQASVAPEKPAFIGERNTQATSDRKPDLTAPPLPSQSGVQPKSSSDFETTNSDYKDGDLPNQEAAKPQETAAAKPTPPAPISEPQESTAAAEKAQMPNKDDSQPSPAPRSKILSGPNPVDVNVPREAPEKSEIKPTPDQPRKEDRPVAKAAELPKPPAAKPVNDPAFRGNQKKTAIVGSISRNGRSALDVADSPLGRYQAVISKAVEQEWQRNCVRHRDFITPGFLTVQFFVESSGKVRTVRFVGEMETGEVQKGFTLNAIRDAEIPAMPATLKKEFAKEPLELIFNFYF